MKYRGNSIPLCIALSATILALSSPVLGQTPEEHAQHHPAPGGGNPAPGGMPMPGGNSAPAQTAAGNMAGMGGDQPTGAGGGGMGAGMGEMMKQMGTPPRKELYPALMALPDEVTPEQRAGIEQLAQERMKAGISLLSSGLEKLSNSTSGEDYAAMQQATVQMREGLAEFEAGIAARRVVSEGKAPRNLALDWFKREMNLASPVRPEEHAFLGVTPFHLFTMALLVAFALAMVAMYFFKMRRAAALFGRLDPDANASPPGASPPLAGTPGPSAPPAEKSPPAQGTPPPSAAPPPPSPAAPPAAKAPAPDAPAAAPSAGTPAASAASPGGSSAVPVPDGDAAKAADKPSVPPVAEVPPASPAKPPAEPDGGDAAKIADRAGELWKARGAPIGSPKIDWLQAEEELAKPAGKPSAPAAGGTLNSPAQPPAVSEAT